MGIFFRKLYIKFLNWINGNGFEMPNANPKTHCMYNYCKAIANNEMINQIQAYEDEIIRLGKKHPEATRNDIARIYVEAIEWVYGKEKV